MSIPLLAMALSAFVMGTAEFVITGLLPDVAVDLGISIPSAGALITGYALAIVVGGPLCTIAGARVSPKAMLLGSMLLFIVGNLVAATAAGYWMLMAGRVLSAFGQASFLGIGSVVAANLVASHLRSRAIAMVFTGITLANVLGTPLGTLLGQNLGWRAIFWVISAVAVLTFVVVAALVPVQPRPRHIGYRAELAMFRRVRVWQTLSIGMLAMGAVFASFSYIAPLLTEVSGFAPSTLTLLLALFGVGLVVGNLLGGWAADRAQLPTFCVALALLTVVMVAFASLARFPVAAAVGLFLIGATGFAVIPAFLSRLINLAGGAGPLAAATGGSAANLGTAFGAYVGGLTINLGLGFTAPSWLGATMAATGFGLALVVWIGHIRSRRRPVDDGVADATLVDSGPAMAQNRMLSSSVQERKF